MCVCRHTVESPSPGHTTCSTTPPPAGGVCVPPIKFCRLHPSEPLQLFCFTCKVLTCRDCQLTAHMNHRYQFVSEALDSLKKQLEVRVQPIRAWGVRVGRSLQDMESRLQELSSSQLNLQKELHRSYGVLTKILKDRMDKLLKEAELVSASESKQVQIILAKVKKLQQVRQTVTDINQKAQSCSDVTSLQTYSAQVELQLNSVSELDSKVPLNMSQMMVVMDKTALEAIMNFGVLKVSWIPFSVSQPSNQKPPPPLPYSRHPLTCNAASPALGYQAAPLPLLIPFLSTPLMPAPASGTPPQIRDKPSPVPVVPPSASGPVIKELKRPSNPLAHKEVQLLPVLYQPTAAAQKWFPALSQLRRLLLPTPPVTQTTVRLVLPVNQTTVRLTPPVNQNPVGLTPLVNHRPAQQKMQKTLQGNLSPASASRQILPTTGTQTTTGPSPTVGPTVGLTIGPSPTVGPTVGPSPTVGLTVGSSPTIGSTVGLSPTIDPTVGPSPTVGPTVGPSPTIDPTVGPSATVDPPVGPSPTIGPTERPIPNVQHNPLRNISSTSTSRPLSSNLFIALRPGVNPGVSPGVRPGVSPGLSPGVRPGVRVVVSPGVCPGVTPVVRAVADSACDCSFQPVTARQEPAENEPTSTMSEEPEPVGKTFSCEVWDKETKEPEPAPEVWDKETKEPEPAPEVWDKETKEPELVTEDSDSETEEPEPAPEVSDSETEEPEPAPEVSDSETEEPEPAGEPSAQEEPHSEAEELSSVIGSPSCSLLKLPVCPPATGRPLPCFGPVLGNAEAEANLQDLSEDPQSPVGESSPESPASLLLVCCSACRSASASIICSFCGRGFHRGCHVPPVGPDLWTEWSCSLCQDLSDPVDPFSSQRLGPPPHLCLSDQRRCESLLLLLRVAGGPQLAQSSLSAISERLSSSYRSVSEFKSDVRKLFSALQDDDFSDKLREEVRRRWKRGSCLEEQEVVRQEQEVVRQEQEVVRQEQEVVRQEQEVPGEEQEVVRQEQEVVRQEQEVVRQEQEVERQEQEVPGEEQEVNSRASRLSQTRKRLRELLMETARSKRARMDTTES